MRIRGVVHVSQGEADAVGSKPFEGAPQGPQRERGAAGVEDPDLRTLAQEGGRHVGRAQREHRFRKMLPAGGKEQDAQTGIPQPTSLLYGGKIPAPRLSSVYMAPFLHVRDLPKAPVWQGRQSG